jgi:hypothetical protein
MTYALVFIAGFVAGVISMFVWIAEKLLPVIDRMEIEAARRRPDGYESEL